MATRPSWDGFLKFNLVSVPVKAYNARARGGGKIGFHLLHRGCNSRIQYKKVCPVHGEVSADEIVSGYEKSKGQYVLVEQDERKKLKVENDKVIDIGAFIPHDAIDPLYFTERTYFLLPEGKVGQRPYAVLREAMAEHDRYAVAQVVFSGRGELALVRPLGQLLAMTLLSYDSQIKQPSTFEADLTKEELTSEERKLAVTLIESATKKSLDLSRYKDEYTEKLTKLIESKRRTVAGPGGDEEDAPAVINLMDALKQSLKKARNGVPAKHGRAKPPAARKHSRRPARRKTA